MRQAKNNLEMAGHKSRELIYKSDIATNYVLEERCAGKVVQPGSKLQTEMGSGVTLVVGMGEGGNVQQIPQLVGFTAREAKSRLWEAGFNVGKDHSRRRDYGPERSGRPGSCAVARHGQPPDAGYEGEFLADSRR